MSLGGSGTDPIQRPLAAVWARNSYYLGTQGWPLLGAKFNPTISFFANRESEEEVNTLWEQLSEGGSVLMALQKYPFSQRYGWLADR